ncbi:Protein kinase, ATP binding site-containing protein [Artemisia annua]|uniref:Protein kinase, ATP binding site-containing protein n=1 Tax=Artemisia annua TaxID=35608 RepID=A0A2U1LMK1_ARTAN|nr:Protein kinase, ATP binding site-containing protein [Artemisia annua]
MSSSSGLRLEDLKIPFKEICLATKDFSEETLIGRSECYNSYKGQFTERLQNCRVAVKRFHSNFNGKGLFYDELQVISRFHHENIISFIGYCDEMDYQKIIVYKYAINGSLGDHLRDPNKLISLTWPQRLKICLGVAKAINYLHFGLDEDCVVIHKNIKSDTILLDENLEAKISKFDFLTLGNRNQQHIYEELFVSFDRNYHIDPIYRESGLLKKEADVYSLGVVMFELLTGTPADREMKIGDDEPLLLINLVRRYYNIDGLDMLIDRQIRNQTDRHSLDTFKETAYRCISYNLTDRPSMDRIIRRITEALDIHKQAAASTITIRSHLHQNLENLLIPLKEIRLATGNFSYAVSQNKSYDRFYKGQLSGRWGNRTALFKLYGRIRNQAEAEFRKELQMMSSLRHEKSIIQLIGYCDEKGEMIIIYDYAVNGSLYSYLRNNSQKPCLIWAQRLKICIGATRGLKNLQASHGEDKILVHRNFRSEKILLDDNMGEVYGIPVDDGFYVDPIHQESGIIKSETDVYPLGVVLFEMLTGMCAWEKRAIEEDEEPQSLISLVRRIIKRLEEALRIQEQGDALMTIAAQSHLSRQDKKLEDYRIPLEEIRLATGDFSEKIGEGGFGVVYKGQSSKSWQNCTVAIKRPNPKGHQGNNGWQNCTVAIKRPNPKGHQGNNGFQNELNMMFRFHHHNIINFIGYCDEDNEMIIVNEYASNGSLEDYLADVLDKKRRSLTWVERLRICIGAAQGLDYLHWGLGEYHRVIHRDIKSGNILLDDNLEAKICDFGLSKSGPKDKPQSKLYTKEAGTPYYIDPLYHESGILQKESDVYSLGVVLFEMLTGMLAYYKRAIEKGEERQFLINLVRRYFDDGLDMLVDPSIKNEMDRRSFHTFKYVAYACISLNSKDRPTIDTIIDRLEEALEFQMLGENPCSLGEQLEPEAIAKVTGDGSDRGSGEYLCPLGEECGFSKSEVQRVRLSLNSCMIKVLSLYDSSLKVSNSAIASSKAGRPYKLAEAPSTLDVYYTQLCSTDKPLSKLYTKAAGTRFYMDPQYHESGMLQKESDVYSLGVVLFEMLTGLLAYYEKAIEKGDEPQFLINLVRRYFDDGLEMLVDPSIKDEMDHRSFHIFKYVAYECISLNPRDRRTMDTIIDRLEEALEFQMLRENPCPVGEQLEPEATEKVTGGGSD